MKEFDLLYLACQWRVYTLLLQDHLMKKLQLFRMFQKIIYIYVKDYETFVLSLIKKKYEKELNDRKNYELLFSDYQYL